MQTLEQLRSGDTAAALAQLQEQVRRDPADPKLRVFLSQLLAVTGQWDRCLTQLKVLGELDAGALAMVQTYQSALTCEALRARVFSGDQVPMIFGEPEHWVALLLESLRLFGQGQAETAKQLRAEAFELAPTTAGEIDGESFEWLADCDARFGPVLEAIINGAYYWMPFARIRELRIHEPADLRDSVWTPVDLLLSNGGTAVGLVPTRYPGSETSDNPQILLARRTEWIEDAAGEYIGLGQRMLATNNGEYPIMDARVIKLETGEGAEADAGLAGRDDA